MSITAVLLFVEVFLTFRMQAQCDPKAWRFDDDERNSFSVGRFVSDALTPQLISDTKKIRVYICDPRFHEQASRCGDIRAVDAIYLKSLRIAEYDIKRALLLSMMGVLEHQQINLRLPILSSVSVPLTFEEDSVFKARLKCLPGNLYPDSPKHGEQDKDKLQHFFASAYLAYVSESPEFARATGDVVEWTEAKVVVGGADDWRDRRSNNQGKSFGRDLLIVKTLLPSDYIQLGLEKEE